MAFLCIMKTIADLTRQIEAVDALNGHHKQPDCEHEALYFIKPAAQPHTVVFRDSPARYVKQTYVYHPLHPRILAMMEENVILPLHYSRISYYFLSSGNDLYVVECNDEYRHNGKAVSYNAFYPYIRLPEQQDKPVVWAYQLRPHVFVYCTSEYTAAGVLRLRREIKCMDEAANGLVTGTMITTETYAAGLGIQSMETIKLRIKS